MGREAAVSEVVPPISCLRSAETLVATRKKSWRLDDQKLDRQRDWLDVSKSHSTSGARLPLGALLAPAPGLELALLDPR